MESTKKSGSGVASGCHGFPRSANGRQLCGDHSVSPNSTQRVDIGFTCWINNQRDLKSINFCEIDEVKYGFGMGKPKISIPAKKCIRT